MKVDPWMATVDPTLRHHASRPATSERMTLLVERRCFFNAQKMTMLPDIFDGKNMENVTSVKKIAFYKLSEANIVILIYIKEDANAFLFLLKLQNSAPTRGPISNNQALLPFITILT